MLDWICQCNDLFYGRSAKLPEFTLNTNCSEGKSQIPVEHVYMEIYAVPSIYRRDFYEIVVQEKEGTTYVHVCMLVVL